MGRWAFLRPSPVRDAAAPAGVLGRPLCRAQGLWPLPGLDSPPRRPCPPARPAGLTTAPLLRQLTGRQERPVPARGGSWAGTVALAMNRPERPHSGAAARCAPSYAVSSPARGLARPAPVPALPSDEADGRCGFLDAGPRCRLSAGLAAALSGGLAPCEGLSACLSSPLGTAQLNPRFGSSPEMHAHAQPRARARAGPAPRGLYLSCAWVCFWKGP